MKHPGWGEEVSLDAEFRPSERWTFQAEARYDLVDDRPRQLGLGLGWRNECVEVDLSWAHRYTSADDGDPSTEFGLSVGLLGFSTSGTRRVAPGTCRG
jgi:LPS-assembly protein